MDSKISFLIVDDDDTIVFTLKSIVGKSFPNVTIYTASDGATGLNLAQTHHPSIILSDYTMPRLDGLQFLKRLRLDERFNDIYFIILTANNDRNILIDALHSGGDDFIFKPINIDELQARLRSASRIVGLQQQYSSENKMLVEMKNELESSLGDLLTLAGKFLQARIPSSGDMLKRVAKSSVWIAKAMNEFDEKQIKEIEVAASLCLVGRLFLPDELLQVPVMLNGRPNHKLMFQVSNVARDIMSSVQRYKPIGNILYSLYENFDGSGIPERLQSWQIPLASRIIRVALDYEEELQRNNKSSSEVLTLLQSESKRIYDHRVIVLFEQFIGTLSSSAQSVSEMAYQLADLKDGMVLARDIITNSGLKLLPAGARLRDNVIQKIFSLNSSDPILGNIYIKLNG
ncbi:MAG: response regulator [Candidatus Kapabacteria bacterium]|nr:response regulator [Candidatus Kapabacteria bacterium]